MLRINSPCARWGSGGWYQVWLGRGFRFLPPQVRQDSIDGLLVLDAGNDPDSTSAMPAGLNVNIEDSLQSLRPGHRRVALCRCPYFRICARLQLLATPGRCDPPTPAVVRGQDAVVTGEIDSGASTKLLSELMQSTVTLRPLCRDYSHQLMAEMS